MKPVFNLKKLLAVACISLAVPLTLHADPMQGDGRGPDHEKSGHCERHHSDLKAGAHGAKLMHGIPPYLRGVELTELQRDQLFKLMYAQLPAMRDQGKLRHKTMQELSALSSAESFDDTKAQQLAAQLATLQKDMVLARARNDAKVFAILTPEQRQQAQEAMKSREQRGYGEPVNFKGRGMEHHRHAPRPTHS